MLIFYSIIFGLVQGLTEFLPVSSSGHLAILHYFLDLGLSDSLSFDVALHWGTFFALFIFFLPDIYRLTKAFFSSLKKWDLKNNFEERLVWMIIVASIPVLLVGYLFGDWLESFFRPLPSVAALLIFVGLLFFYYEKVSSKTDNINQLTFGKVLIIGLAQVLALVPGVSRSGITIIAGLEQNLKREEAARFSFLLSLPAVFGAAVKKIFDISKVGLPANEVILFVVGLATSFIVGYFALRFFLKYLENHSLNIFGWYRIILGLAVLVLFYFIK